MAMSMSPLDVRVYFVGQLFDLLFPKLRSQMKSKHSERKGRMVSDNPESCHFVPKELRIKKVQNCEDFLILTTVGVLILVLCYRNLRSPHLPSLSD
jgi:hypothetical protein